MTSIDPLISAETLAGRLDDPNLRIVDCRWVLGAPGAGARAYADGHIRGAIHLDVDGDLAASAQIGPGRHPLPEVATFVRRLEEVGIGDGQFVVAYDDSGGWVAARLWWMLDVLGHHEVAVLDGGWGRWLAIDGPTTTAVPAWPPAHLSVADDWSRTIDRETLRVRLGTVTLLDARGAPRYRGETEPIDAYPGHIPTARNAPTDGVLRSDGLFLDREALVERFRTLGADGTSGEVVTSCGSGVSACVNALALRIAGLPDPILYPGSYSDWSRAGWPVVVGPDPGDPPTR